jgi:predicted nucleotidyltransferase
LEALKTILYFSLFKYPLKLEDICNFSNSKNAAEIENELEVLVLKKIIYKIDEFYLSEYDSGSVERRRKGNHMAIFAMKKAKERAELIAKFPYVEAVGISGSLSKGYYDDESDIDFFVISTSNRLWITRTLLMLYKKIFLLNSRKYFCINYFISTNNLEIEEKNRFTATEIKTLIPMQGQCVFEEFYKKNNWVSTFFGEMNPLLDNVPNIKKPILTKGIETILNLRIGVFFDRFFRKITVLKWKSKFRDMEKEDFKIALKSTTDISKHHPLNFQKKVIVALNEKYRKFQQQHNIELPEEHA